MTKVTKTKRKPRIKRPGQVCKRLSKADELLAARLDAMVSRVVAVEQKIRAAVDGGLLRHPIADNVEHGPRYE
jgi:hypothetical protein